MNSAMRPSFKIFLLRKVLTDLVNSTQVPQKNNANTQCQLKNAIKTPPKWTLKK